MTLTPDRTGFHAPGEVGDPQLVHLVSTHRDATYPHTGPMDLKAAENAVLHHVQAWHDSPDLDMRVAHACLVADLGKWVNPQRFAELVWDYQPEMTPEQADVWTAELTLYLTDHDYRKA